MKKGLLFLIPVLFGMTACDTGGEDITIEQLRKEFNFKKYSKEAITDILEELQNASGYEVNFTFNHFDDINEPEPTLTANGIVGGVGNVTWCYVTQNGVTNGGAIKTDNDTFTYYWYENSVWENVGSDEYKINKIVNSFDKEIDKLILKSEYASKINFSSDIHETEYISSEECYKFTCSEEDLEIKIDVSKYLGIAMYYSVIVIDSSGDDLIVTKDELRVNSIGLTNIVAPKI